MQVNQHKRDQRGQSEIHDRDKKNRRAIHYQTVLAEVVYEEWGNRTGGDKGLPGPLILGFLTDIHFEHSQAVLVPAKPDLPIARDLHSMYSKLARCA
jgi:hypothetical protein